MNKKGFVNICISLGVVIVIVILISVFLIYFQVNVLISEIRQELYYELQNGMLAIEKDELALNSYLIDNKKLTEQINNWIQTSGKSKLNVIDIKIKEITTNNKNKKATFKVKLTVAFKPIINIKQVASIDITNDIDLSLLKLNENR